MLQNFLDTQFSPINLDLKRQVSKPFLQTLCFFKFIHGSAPFEPFVLDIGFKNPTFSWIKRVLTSGFYKHFLAIPVFVLHGFECLLSCAAIKHNHNQALVKTLAALGKRILVAVSFDKVQFII